MREILHAIRNTIRQALRMRRKDQLADADVLENENLVHFAAAKTMWVLSVKGPRIFGQLAGYKTTGTIQFPISADTL